MRLLLEANRRDRFTRSSLRHLRSQGKIPAVVYGSDTAPLSIAVSINALKDKLRRGFGGRIDLAIDGAEPFPVLVKDIQVDPLTGRWLHVDLHRVRSDKPVRVRVPLEYTGTPVGTKTGGVLQIQQTYVEAEGLPAHLPASVRVDIASLRIGDKLFAADVRLPAQVKLLSPPLELLVSVVAPKQGDAEAGTDAAEPMAEAG